MRLSILGHFFVAAVVLVISLGLAPVGAEPPGAGSNASKTTLQRFEYTQLHMAVEFRIVLYAPERDTADRAASAAFDRIEQLNGLLSDYDPKSELSRLSVQSPTAHPVAVSPDLWQVLSQSQRLARRSGGAFDVTVGPLTALWRQSRRSGRMVPANELAAARGAVGDQFLKLDAARRTVELLRANMRLDVGGIAKGYASDEAIRTLAAHGVTRALVAASGDIAVGDPPPDQPGWRVAVAPLRADDGKALSPGQLLLLSHRGVSTSGDAQQHVVIDGVRYSHIIDPRTGLGLKTVSSVTIVASDDTTADAIATAVDVLGPRRGMSLVRSTPGAEALFVIVTEKGTESFSTKGFAALTVKP